MILSFDVDCGELVPGHRFIARGLSGPSRMPIPDDWDGNSAEYERMLEFEDAGGYPAFALEYELVPGVTAAEGAEDFFRYLAGIDYHADVELPWYPTDGGAIAPFEGGAATHGARGDWPLPPEATILTFALFGTTQAGFGDRENPTGVLVVSLIRGEAVWHPADPASRTE